MVSTTNVFSSVVVWTGLMLLLAVIGRTAVESAKDVKVGCRLPGTEPAKSEQERIERDLRAICKGDHTLELLSTVKDLHEFNEALDGPAEGIDCSEFAADALRTLVKITAEPEACSLSKAKALAAYSRKYLVHRELLPHALYRFAVAYGMEMSKICKHHLLNEWLPRAEDVTLEYHFQVFNDWTHPESSVSRLLDSLAKRGAFLLPSDLWSALPDDRVKQKLTLKTAYSGQINKAKKVCTERFMPLYEPIVMPLAVLTRSGFDFSGIVLKGEQTLYSRRRELIVDWSKIVFVCEILKFVDRIESQPSDEKLEADEMKASRSEKRFRFHENWTKRYEVVAKIDRETKIFNELDLPLLAAVLSFNPNTHEVDRLKAKILKRSWRLLSTNFKYGQFKAMVKTFFKLMSNKFQNRGSKDKEQELKRRNEENLEMINDNLVRALESKGESKVYRIVAGFANFGKAVLGGAIHFIVTVSLFVASIALLCFPGKLADKVNKKIEIMVE